ncbi:NAD(P)-dependent oxidoreductase [Croceibacterium sp. TMG7-5b_MA50]|uniref:precorrin-2 dehydrogenase/sirohydrochlorin ferrochelatase family protein n=1 Tax=Croceibacterium sp. TMG7-5b_MA50 TaxID=3121290 RepID=UPI0032219E84
MRSLPLFHRIAGHPVIVLGDGDGAEPKRRLVERAGGQVIADMAAGIAAGARLAFVGHDDAARCEADAEQLRAAGLLVNVVDRPELCDFTTPSLLDRDPVLIAIGSDGTSAGLVKQLRLRLESLLPADLGRLALALHAARAALRGRWPGAAERRRAIDAALAAGGILDPLQDAAADRVPIWLGDDEADGAAATLLELTVRSDDPDELTIRQARLLGTADVLLVPADFPPAILARARADAVRMDDSPDVVASSGRLVLRLRRA